MSAVSRELVYKCNTRSHVDPKMIPILECGFVGSVTLVTLICHKGPMIFTEMNFFYTEQCKSLKLKLGRIVIILKCEDWKDRYIQEKFV